MLWHWISRNINEGPAVVAALFLLILVACSPSATALPSPSAVPTAETAVPSATPVPTATALPTPGESTGGAATPTPAVNAKPAGTLNVAFKELGAYLGSPRLAGNPQISINSSAPIIETLVMHDENDGALVPMLAAEWTISEDGLTWIFDLQRGVEFHKGYGEMTAEDVIFSHRMVSESERHARASVVGNVWFNDAGGIETPDPYTIVLNTGVPFADVTMLEMMRTPTGSGIWTVSKKQAEEVSEEQSNQNTAATGPWEIDEFATGDFWRMKAVENHWRKTPEFAEMVFWELPDQATQLVGIKTDVLDAIVVSIDALPAVEDANDIRIMQLPNAGVAGINFYGQSYVGIGTPDQKPNYDPDLPWVSSDPDINSEEWDRARKVREALSISIDRGLIVDTILQGFGRESGMRDWTGHEDRLPPGLTWEFNLERAKELLIEAGYPDGFPITLTPAVRGAPSEVEACEAIGQMWENLGLSVELQRWPYGTLRPQLIGREYKGATCHSLSPRLEPVLGLSNYLSTSLFNWGTDHPVLEELIPKARAAIAKDERERFELESVRFLYDQVLGGLGLYVFDAAVAVGPSIETWEPHIKKGGTQFNGFEWIQARER